MIWDDAALKLLRERVADKVPAPEIARELGTSKNSVIGKAHRLGLRWKEKPKPKPKPKPRVIVRAKPKPKPRPYRMRSLMELTDADCRYIHGHVITGRVFCGRQVLKGSRYCPEHHQRLHHGVRY